MRQCKPSWTRLVAWIKAGFFWSRSGSVILREFSSIGSSNLRDRSRIGRYWRGLNPVGPETVDRLVTNVTRLGDLLDCGQLFKAFADNLICPNLPHSLAIYVTVSKSFIFLVKSVLGNFYRHLAIFYWSHCLLLTEHQLTLHLSTGQHSCLQPTLTTRVRILLTDVFSLNSQKLAVYQFRGGK